MIGSFEDYQEAVELAGWYARNSWCSGSKVVTEADGSYSVVWYDNNGNAWYA